jgi:hypothetical protein
LRKPALSARCESRSWPASLACARQHSRFAAQPIARAAPHTRELDELERDYLRLNWLKPVFEHLCHYSLGVPGTGHLHRLQIMQCGAIGRGLAHARHVSRHDRRRRGRLSCGIGVEQLQMRQFLGQDLDGRNGHRCANPPQRRSRSACSPTFRPSISISAVWGTSKQPKWDNRPNCIRKFLEWADQREN